MICNNVLYNRPSTDTLLSIFFFLCCSYLPKLSIAADLNMVLAELTTTSPEVNKNKRSLQKDDATTVKQPRKKSRTTADKNNRAANQLIKNNMNSTTKKKFCCTMCPNIYFDRTGFYKHKIRNHQKSTGHAVNQSLSGDATETINLTADNNATTADYTSTVQSTSMTLQVVEQISSPVSQSIQGSMSDISLTSTAQVSDTTMPNCAQPQSDVILSDIHLSTSETDIVNQILTSSNTESDSHKDVFLSQAVQDVVMHGKYQQLEFTTRITRVRCFSQQMA